MKANGLMGRNIWLAFRAQPRETLSLPMKLRTWTNNNEQTHNTIYMHTDINNERYRYAICNIHIYRKMTKTDNS